jgi:hypothetical protein
MIVPRGRILLNMGAGLLAVIACFHAAGWSSLRDEFPGTIPPLVRLLWFSVDLDWLVVALIWALAARAGTAALRLPAFAASLIPIGSALWLAVTIGPGFVGVYALALAAILALLGAQRLGRVQV